jgi:Co/Zn/Cd efflux system component
MSRPETLTLPRAGESGHVLAVCGTHHWALDTWDLLFHVGLFATFFNLFFYFRLRKSYDTSASNIAEGFGSMIQALPPSLQSLLHPPDPERVQENASAAGAKRNHANGRAFALACIPMVLLWVLVIVWGACLLKAGYRLTPVATNTLRIFLLFCVIELLIFSLVVSRYLPQTRTALLRAYTDAFADAISSIVCGGRG